MANEQAKAFLDQATQSLQNSQFQQALDLVEQAIAIDSNVSDAYVLKGICLSQLSQPDAAVEAFRKAIMISPYNAKAYYNWAVHQNGQGNKKEAAELAREAVGVDPRHTGARQLLSQLEQELAGVSPNPVGEKIDVAPSPNASSAPPSGIPGAGPPKPEPSAQAAAPVQSRAPSPEAKRPAPSGPTGAAPHANANPYAGVTPTSQFSHQGFNRPGYVEPSSALPWVSGMGKAWPAIAWILVLAWIPILIALINISRNIVEQHITDPQEIMKMGAGVVDVLLLVLAVLTIFWTICDTLDRRSSGWWVAGMVICSCFGLNVVLLPIYLLVGRRDA